MAMSLRDHEAVVSAFLADPRILATPEAYAHAPEHALPMPDVRLEFRGVAAAVGQTVQGRTARRTRSAAVPYSTLTTIPARPSTHRVNALDRSLELTTP